MTLETSSLAAGRPTETRRPRSRILSRFVSRMLPTPVAGQLALLLPDGHTVHRCGVEVGPSAEFSVRHWRGLLRMLVDGEHGFADGYLDGAWSTPDLRALLEFFMRNETLFASQTDPSWLSNALHRLVHHGRENTRGRSRKNIAAHYDLGNRFYREWLDAGMNYSSALFGADETLEAAQKAKLDRVAELLELSGGESVLEIGCGWGALAERLLRRSKCAVLGVTLSAEQLAYARSRLAAEIGEGRADLRLQDYRDIRGRFDRIASIEMIEAVGERYWPLYFDKLREALVPGGIAVLQAITISENRFEAYRRRPDFIQRHIFPGGMLPTPARIEAEVARSGLTLVHQERFGESYARTLAFWRSRFAESWKRIEPLGFDARFRRMWDYYLAYCEVGFRSGAIDVSFFKLRG